ncbi:unnamed protein product [Miscanthus lutarioriparius]|uniref:Uncharacterized protein n=1 Tax=Miscanthus lutarioriparius TaxID=422564 RepID=A0A811NZQ3_9POAL|nr:unnamed protein product [Miscanthus lutarioriparius]
MADRFPELYIQSLQQSGSDSAASSAAWAHRFTSCATSLVATEQLDEAMQIANQQVLTTEQDRRKSLLLKPDGDLDTSAIYSALKTANATPDAWTKFVWKKQAPKIGRQGTE